MTSISLAPCPLMWAAMNDVSKVIELLVEKGADVNATDSINRTALMIADDPDVVRLLIVKGADVNAKTKTGETPLTLAKAGKTAEIVELLIANGAKE